MNSDMVETWEQFEAWLQDTQTAIRKSDFGRVEGLLSEAQQHIKRLSDTPLSAPTKQRVLDTYRRLTLMISAQRSEIQGQITRLHKGKRALGGYRLNQERPINQPYVTRKEQNEGIERSEVIDTI